MNYQKRLAKVINNLKDFESLKDCEEYEIDLS